MYDSGLVLEGGGMRGVFTAGVLDFFIDAGVEFPYVIGVSAGSSNGLSYASKQRGRAKKSNIDFLGKTRYISLKRLLFKGEIMNFDLLFEHLPRKILPYDFEAYKNFKGRFVIVTSNCLTGRAQYFENPKTLDDLLSVCRASCSLPFLTRIHSVNGIPMFDGGVCDPIPFKKALDDGCGKIVAVLTRNLGYRKDWFFVPPFAYGKYPNMRRALKEKTALYNAEIEALENMERAGKAFVIRPKKSLKVGRMGKDIGKLAALYEEGYEEAKNSFEKMKNFLKK